MANPFTSAQAPAPNMAMQLIAPELAAQQMSNARMQKIAQLLQEKALEADNRGQTQVVGGWAIPNSPLSGLSTALQGGIGAFMQAKADEKNAELMKSYSKRLNDVASGGSSDTISGQQNQQIGAQSDQSGQQVGVGQTIQAQPGRTSSDQFNLKNLIRGLAIGAIGGDQAGSAYYKGLTPTEMELQNRYLGIDPNTARQAKLAEMIKQGTQSFQPGQTNILPSGERIVAPDFKEGIAGGFDATGMPIVNPIHGANQAAAERASMMASANEGAKPTTVTLPDGRSIFTTVGSTLGQTQPSAAPSDIQPLGAAPAYTDIDKKYGFPPGTIASLANVESGGNPNALSKAGAEGKFQIMPETQRQPGYGLGKLDPNNPDHAGAYLRKMVDLSGGSLEGGLAKYNSGPGGNPNNPETKAYVPKVIAGIPGYKGVGSATQQPGQPKGLEVQSPSGEVFSKEDAKQKVDFASKYEESMSNNLKKSSELMQRLNVTEKALKEFKAGGGTETRAKAAQMAQALKLPQSLVDKVAGGDLGAIQVVNKTALTESLLQMQHDLASDTGAAQKSNQAIMERYLDANPHPDTDPRAWEKLLNMQKEIYSNKLGEAKEYWQYKDENKGDTRRFPTYWAGKKSDSLDVTKTNNNPFNSKAKQSGAIGTQMTAERWATMKSGDTFVDAQGNTRRKP